MTSGGEAADQIVRMSLEAGEIIFKITGSAAKDIAIMLFTLLKNKSEKSQGKVRMKSLMKLTNDQTVFTVKDSDLKTFVKNAKDYGILYSAVRGRKDGMTDLIIRTEDVKKVNHLMERYHLSAVNSGTIHTDYVRNKDVKETASENGISETEQSAVSQSQAEEMLDELFGKDEPEKSEDFFQKGRKENPSGRLSEKPEKEAEEGLSEPDKPSVKKQLKEIQDKRKQDTTVKKEKNRQTYAPVNQNKKRKRKRER